MPVIKIPIAFPEAPDAQPLMTGVPFVRGVLLYLRGAWLFFKKMWPAIYALSTAETNIYASAITFNAALSFFSFLVLVGSLLVHVFEWQAGYEMLYRLMRTFVPSESGAVIVALDKVTRGMGSNAGWLSMLMLVFSSTGVFMPLEVALNRAWGFKTERGSIKRRLIYFPVVIGCVAVVLCAAALGSALEQALSFVFSSPTAHRLVFSVISLLIALPCLTGIFFLIYYWVPGEKVLGSQIFFASTAMAVLWVIVTFVYQMLLPSLHYRNRYGGLFTVVTVVMWIFLSAYILILGANLSARDILPRAWAGDLPMGMSLRLDELPENLVTLAVRVVEDDEENNAGLAATASTEITTQAMLTANDAPQAGEK